MSIHVLRGQTPRQQAAAVADANYEQLKDLVINTVQGKLAAGNIRLPQVDLEAAYNYGWHGVCEHIAQGGPVITLTGFVIDVTYKRALDVYRQRHEGRHADADLDSHTVEVDLAERVDDQQKIQRLFERLKDRLNAKERNAVTLCVLHGFKRAEAAERLGIPEPAFQKIMDSATKKIARIVAGMEARGCGDDEWARAIRAFALGLMSTETDEYARMARHVQECESCKRYVTCLQSLAAVFPPTGLLMPLGGHEGSILAQLYRLFGTSGHGSAAASAIQTASAGGTAAGGGVSTSLGGAVAAKGGLAVIAVAGLTVAATLGVKQGHAKGAHPHPHHATVSTAHAPESAVNLPRAPSSHVAARSKLATNHRPAARHKKTTTAGTAAALATQAAKEFGPETNSSSTSAPQSRATRVSGNSTAAQIHRIRSAATREFGPEH